MLTMQTLIEKLRAGCVLHPRRWSGDTHADLGGSIDEAATDTIMAEAADALEQAPALYQHDDGRYALALGDAARHRLTDGDPGWHRVPLDVVETAAATVGPAAAQGFTAHDMADMGAAQFDAGQSASHWQPIETAPKDGTRVLLAVPPSRVSDGAWDAQYGEWALAFVYVRPSHWMPMPPLPKGGEEGA